MQNWIQLLEKTLVEARETKAQHAEQIEALKAAFDQKLTQERVELLEAYEQKIIDLRHAHARDTDALNGDFKLLKESTEEARELQAKVEAQTVGVLPTESLPARMFFEKLSEHWSNISQKDMDFIGEYLDKIIWLAVKSL